MNVILLSGGSGKNLWPLSNDIHSKQFIKLFKTQVGQNESMIQRINRQVRLVDPKAEITVATSKSQASTVINQLGSRVGISAEPERRNTFPAVVLALEYLKDVKGVKPSEPIIVCPVDIYVEDALFFELKKLYESINEKTGILMLGSKPKKAVSQYGYILPKSKEKWSEVKSFTEKPSEEEAKKLISKGALWNVGAFAFQMKYLLEVAHKRINYQGYDDLFNHYSSLPIESFDTIVKSGEVSCSVMCSKYSLNDLGNWESLMNATQQKIIGKAIVSDSCKDVNVVNDMDVPILAVGMENTVIAASQQGILVIPKDGKESIEQYVDRISHQVMFADKSWGSMKVLDVDDQSMTLHLYINAGKRMSYHSHAHRDEMWTILSGKGRTIVDGMEQSVQAGDVITMEKGCRHTIIADTDVELIEIQRGSEINIKDKKKYELE